MYYRNAGNECNLRLHAGFALLSDAVALWCRFLT
jgi:hypothetical protein